MTDMEQRVLEFIQNTEHKEAYDVDISDGIDPSGNADKEVLRALMSLVADGKLIQIGMDGIKKGYSGILLYRLA